MIAFSHPWALLLALPAAWLLWRSRRRSVQTHAVANLFLWQDASSAETELRRERRAPPPWLAWLQAAVLVALAVAIAAPSLATSRPDATLIIDLSASMSAQAGSTSRWAVAQQAAKTWLVAQPPRRVIRVIGAGAQAKTVATLRARSSEAPKVIDGLAPEDGSDSIVTAIEMARRESPGPITVISDRRSPAEAVPLGIDWQQVGIPVDNVSITALTGTNDGGAVLELTNFGRSPRRVELDVTGGPGLWHESIEISASGARAFAFAPAGNRTLTATLKTDDNGNAIRTDDRRSVAIKASRPRVALVSDNPMLKSALEALPDIDLDALNQGSRPDVIVTSGATSGHDVPALIFATGGTVPTIVKREVNGVRIIDVAVDLSSSSWTLTPSFPVFIADSIDWLSGRTAQALSAADVASIVESDTRSAEPPRLADVGVASASVAPRGVWLAVATFALLGLALDLALRRRAVQVRLIAAAVLVAALAGLPLPIGSAGRAAVVALDSSASVAGNQRRAADRAARETEAATESDRVTTVKFGGAETDIAAGLRNAFAVLPAAGDRRVLLITDGQQTVGDSADEARNAGVPIDVVPVDSRVPAYIARVDAPMTARAGAPIPVRVSVSGSPNEVLRLTVSRDGADLDARRIVLNDAGAAAVDITDRPERSGVTFYRVVLADERLGLALSESGAATAVAGRGKILVISNRAAASLPLASGSLDVANTRPSDAPDTRDALSPFSAIVIDGIQPHHLSVRQLDAIAAAVSLDGAGLLFLGSRDGLDASEFPPGAFSESLPIDFTAPPRPPASSTALALLVDISGSMASTSDGVTKIAAARDAIARALAIVPAADAVEVIGFATSPQLLIGPGDPRDNASVVEKLKSLSPSGSTALAPAVAEAAAWLKRAAGTRRRLLLVTDGKTSVSDAQATRAAVAGQSIEVSVVTIGRDAERDWLTELAASTGGRAYFPDRLTDLAREVAREAARGSSGRDIDERFTVRGGAHPLAPGDTAPVLDGYIAGRLRDGATAAWKSRTDDAVLAAWQRGIGRVAVFSSDFNGPWGAPLKNWRENSSFWRRAIEWLARGSDPSAIDVVLANSNDGPRIVVDLGGEKRSPASSSDLPTVSATVAGPGGQTVTTALHPVSTSRFEGPAPLGETGDYRATISVVFDGTETRASRGWFWAGDRESEARGVNLPLLEEIARVSGGRLLPPIGAPVDASQTLFGVPRTRRPVNAVPWLLFAALALLSFDYIRRATEVPVS